MVGCAASRQFEYRETAEFNAMDFGSCQVIINKKFAPSSKPVTLTFSSAMSD
jgi:hypothetical protein